MRVCVGGDHAGFELKSAILVASTTGEPDFLPGILGAAEIDTKKPCHDVT